MNVVQLGKIITGHRKASGQTQAELARLAGVGKTVVFDIEHGKDSLRFDKLLKILSALNIELELSSPILSEVLTEIKQTKAKQK